MRVPKYNKPTKTPAKIEIQWDQTSGVAKSIVAISIQVHEKTPTLDQPDLRIEFMVQGKSSTLTTKTNNEYLFIFYFMI